MLKYYHFLFYHLGLLTGASALSLLQVLICCCQIIFPRKQLEGQVDSKSDIKKQQAENVQNNSNDVVVIENNDDNRVFARRKIPEL